MGMLDKLHAFLVRLKLIPKFTDDEINADMENHLRDHEDMVQKVREGRERRVQTTRTLRANIAQAKARTGWGEMHDFVERHRGRHG